MTVWAGHSAATKRSQPSAANQGGQRGKVGQGVAVIGLAFDWRRRNMALPGAGRANLITTGTSPVPILIGGSCRAFGFHGE